MAEFKKILDSTLHNCKLSVDEKAAERLCAYYHLLIEWNEKMNLTALTEPEDVALKHFADSLMLLEYVAIPDGASVIDVGTGAGFPGLVLKIARPDIRLTLLDSLNKRLVFLEEVCEQLALDGVEIVHARAEDGARTELRDSFDFAVSRAVAPLNILAEYTLPYVKVGGELAAMKGKDADAELFAAQGAISALSGEIMRSDTFILPGAGERAIIAIKKIAPTSDKYPRTGKKIKSKPL